MDHLTEDPLEKAIREAEEEVKKLEQEAATAFPRKRRRPQVPVPLIPQPTAPLKFPDVRTIDPYDPATFGFVEIGEITRAHGIHGWVRVRARTDYPARLTTPGMILYCKPPNRRSPEKIMLIEGRMTTTTSFLIQLEGSDTRDKASVYIGYKLYYASEEDTVKDEGDVLLTDMVGLTVKISRQHGEPTEWEKQQTPVGKGSGIVFGDDICTIKGLSHDYLEVLLHVPPGSKPRNERVLIPIVDEIVTNVDFEAQTIWIDPPDGLLDLKYIPKERISIRGMLPTEMADPSEENLSQGEHIVIQTPQEAKIDIQITEDTMLDILASQQDEIQAPEEKFEILFPRLKSEIVK